MKKQSLLLGVSLALLVGYAASAAEQPKPKAANTYDNLQLLMEVFERVRADYVEKPDDGKVIEGAVEGMVAALDPHSSYMSPDDNEQFNAQMSGEYSGIGIEISMEDGLIRVVSPIDDGPAAKAGIRAGDYIVKINGEDAQGQTIDQAILKMRGTPGTKITVTIARKEAPKPFDVVLTRDNIRIESVRWRVERGDIGYIRITQFTRRTQSGMENAFTDLDKKLGPKLKAYVLDLRSNPGGALEQAVAVSDDFLDKGEIVSMRGRKPRDNGRWDATKGDLAHGKPVIVLINSGTASASEIVAGALQDQKRASLLGARSFGKGVVQTVLELENGGALRLTTARYYTPSGRSIQAEGIVPDIVVEQPLPPGYEDYQPRREEDLANHIANENGSRDKTEKDESPAAARQTPPSSATAASAQSQPAGSARTATARTATAGQPAEDAQLNYALDLLEGKRPWPKPETAKVAAAGK